MDGGTTQWVPMEEVAGIGEGGGIIRPCSLPFNQTSEKPKSVSGVRSCGSPPPFLTKTLVMVEDPETNFIISWSSSGTSFIIWDHLRFAKELLPKYFKHSNFSSFIYQLNNYCRSGLKNELVHPIIFPNELPNSEGFKKIGLRKYEYENKWFQAGKQHLLVNMKRRNNEAPKSTRRLRGQRKLCRNAEKSRMVVELENLRENIYSIKLEIQKLKQKKGDLENHIATFKELGKDMESKAQKMFLFLGRIFNPYFPQQVIANSGEEEELESHESVKKMRLIAPKSTGNSADSTDNVNILSGNNQDIPPEKQTMSSVDDSGSQIQGQEVNNSISEAIAAKNSDPLIFWKKLLEDDSVTENEEDEQELAQQHSKIDMAFDDMMASKIVMEVEDVIAKEPITDMDDEVTFQLWA